MEGIAKKLYELNSKDNIGKISTKAKDITAKIQDNFEAETALRLKSSVKINNVPFDGSYDITIEDFTKSPISHTHNYRDIVDIDILIGKRIEQYLKCGMDTDVKILNLQSKIDLLAQQFESDFKEITRKIPANIVEDSSINSEENTLKEKLYLARNRLKNILEDEELDEYCEIFRTQNTRHSEKESLKSEIIELTNKLYPPYKRRRNYTVEENH